MIYLFSSIRPNSKRRAPTPPDGIRRGRGRPKKPKVPKVPKVPKKTGRPSKYNAQVNISNCKADFFMSNLLILSQVEQFDPDSIAAMKALITGPESRGFPITDMLVLHDNKVGEKRQLVSVVKKAYFRALIGRKLKSMLNEIS